MKGLAVAAALSTALSVAPMFVAVPHAAAPAAAAPQAAAPAPAPRPEPAQGLPTPPAPAPVLAVFPEGAKYAFVNIQRIANESNEGKVATTRVNALVTKKQAEGTQKATQLQAAQQKLEAGGSVLSDNARATLQKDIDRMTLDVQRFNEDAQQEVQALQNELQTEFQNRLTPIIQAVARERALHAIFSMADSGLVWGDPGLDITADVIRKFDAAAPVPAVAAPAAPRPAAPAAARPAAPAAPAAPRPQGN
ncbi:MAG: OmpH family outer membrane protein [Vicinamibacterales bacterium]